MRAWWYAFVYELTRWFIGIFLGPKAVCDAARGHEWKAILDMPARQRNQNAEWHEVELVLVCTVCEEEMVFPTFEDYTDWTISKVVDHATNNKPS